MLAPLAQQADRFLAGAEVLFEVACRAGVPDLVLLDVDHDAIAARAGTAALVEPVDVRVMLALKASPMRRLTTDALSTAVLVSPGHLRRRVIPRLVEGGHLEHADDGWRSVSDGRSLARKIITIEMKRRDWRGGLAQAGRHTAVADEAWLVLDAQTSHAAASHEDWFSTCSVGLASLSFNGGLTMLVRPTVNRSRPQHRELLVERAINLMRQGVSSGPLPRVFGSVLVASTGDDPRLPGGAARSAR